MSIVVGLRKRITEIYVKHFKYRFIDDMTIKRAQAMTNSILDEYEIIDEVEIKVDSYKDKIVFRIIKAPNWFIERWNNLEEEQNNIS